MEDYFVPAIVEFKGHGTLEGLDASNRLVVGADEGALDILVIEQGHLKAEVLVQLRRGSATFFTNSTITGRRILMEFVLVPGKATKLLAILLPLISKTGSSKSRSVMRLM